MEIIEASEKHIPEITKLWIEFMYFNTEIEPFDTSGDNVLTQVETHLRNKITSDDSLVLVAMDDQKVVGYSISQITRMPPFSRGNTVGVIYDMAITASHRRKGIGKEMLDGIKTWFKERDIKRIEISVVTKNTIGDSFWREQGFQDYEQILYVEN
ncbi:MAG: GNAT family N-acetyltransferase [Dehalococcoidales bacterium]|nr:MAG: GNAT family N-acetyltransferase [Dehalococcoidales bacterium]